MIIAAFINLVEVRDGIFSRDPVIQVQHLIEGMREKRKRCLENVHVTKILIMVDMRTLVTFFG